ncbi:MAG: hypothetical protein GX262_01270 [Clostridia bacterium]|nr:hypothetical protein [Clostridia bacterium]
MNFDEKEIVKLLRLLNHDYLNHFQVMSGYLQLGRSQEALAHLKEIVNVFSSRHNLLRWICPATVLLVLLWQQRFFEDEKKLVVQSNTDLRGIALSEEQLNNLLDSLFNTLYLAGNEEAGDSWLLKVEDGGQEHIFAIEYLGETRPECDWSRVQCQAEEMGCRLEKGDDNCYRRLVLPKGISWLVAE